MLESTQLPSSTKLGLITVFTPRKPRKALMAPLYNLPVIDLPVTAIMEIIGFRTLEGM